MKIMSSVLEGKLTIASNIQTSQYSDNITLLKCGFFFSKEGVYFFL